MYVYALRSVFVFTAVLHGGMVRVYVFKEHVRLTSAFMRILNCPE